MDFVKISELKRRYSLEEESTNSLSESREYVKDNIYSCDYRLYSNFPVCRTLMLRGGEGEFEFENTQFEFQTERRLDTTNLFKVFFKPKTEGNKTFELILKAIGREREVLLLKRTLRAKPSEIEEIQPELIEDEKEKLAVNNEYSIGGVYTGKYTLKTNLKTAGMLSLGENNLLALQDANGNTVNSLIVPIGKNILAFSVTFKPLSAIATPLIIYLKIGVTQSSLLDRTLTVQSLKLSLIEDETERLLADGNYKVGHEYKGKYKLSSKLTVSGMLSLNENSLLTLQDTDGNTVNSLIIPIGENTLEFSVTFKPLSEISTPLIIYLKIGVAQLSLLDRTLTVKPDEYKVIEDTTKKLSSDGQYMAGHNYIGKYILKTNLVIAGIMSLIENISFILQDDSGSVVKNLNVPTGPSQLPFSVTFKPAEPGVTELGISLKSGASEAMLFERKLTAKPAEPKIIEDEKEKLVAGGEYMAGHDYFGKYTLKTNLESEGTLALVPNQALTLQGADGKPAETLSVPKGTSRLGFRVMYKPKEAGEIALDITLKVGDAKALSLLNRKLIAKPSEPKIVEDEEEKLIEDEEYMADHDYVGKYTLKTNLESEGTLALVPNQALTLQGADGKPAETLSVPKGTSRLGFRVMYKPKEAGEIALDITLKVGDAKALSLLNRKLIAKPSEPKIVEDEEEKLIEDEEYMADHDYVGKYTLKTNLESEGTLALVPNQALTLQNDKGETVETLAVATGPSQLPFEVMYKPKEAGEIALDITLKVGANEALSLLNRKLIAKPSEPKIVENNKEKLVEGGEYMAGHDYVGKYTLKTNLETVGTLAIVPNQALTLQNDKGETVETLAVATGPSQLPFEVMYKPKEAGEIALDITLKVGANEALSLLNRKLIAKPSEPKILEDEEEELAADGEYMVGQDYVGKYTLKTNLETVGTLSLNENSTLELQDTSKTVVKSIVVPTGASKLPFGVYFKPLSAISTPFAIELKIGDAQPTILLDRTLTVKESNATD